MTSSPDVPRCRRRLGVARLLWAGAMTASFATALVSQTALAAEADDSPTYRVGDLIKSGALPDWELENFKASETRISRKHTDGRTGYARTTFQGPEGYYKVRVHYLDEPDGVAGAEFAVGDKEIGSWRFDGIVVSSLRWKEFDGVHIKPGDVLTISGRKGGYEYCRMMGVEILPSDQQASTTAEPVQAKDFSQDLVPLAETRELALHSANRTLPLHGIYTGNRGQYLLHLNEGQRFLLKSAAGYARRESGVQFELTPVGGDQPAQQGSLQTGTPHPVYAWLKADQGGLYTLNVQSPPGLNPDLRVTFDVPAVYPLDQADPQLPRQGFFFVPAGTKAVGINIRGRAIVLDSAGNALLDDWISNRKQTRIDVPEGSDDQLWYYQGAMTGLVGVPGYISSRPEMMLVPREVLGSSATAAK